MTKRNLVEAIFVCLLVITLILGFSVSISSSEAEPATSPECTEEIADNSIDEVLPSFDKTRVEISVKESIDEMSNFITENVKTVILVDGWVSSLDYGSVISKFETLYRDQSLSLESVPLFLVYGDEAIRISSFDELDIKNCGESIDEYVEIPDFYTICNTIDVGDFDRLIVWTDFTYDLLHLDKWENFSDKKCPFNETELVIYETSNTDFNSIYQEALCLEGKSRYQMITGCQEMAYDLYGVDLFYRHVIY